MKHLKRIISLILVIAVFIGSFIGSFKLFNHGTYSFDIQNLFVFDEDESCYYLQSVDRNIIFRIDSTDSADNSFTLYDNDGNVITTKTERVSINSFNILPPGNGYSGGSRYTLSLSENASFNNTDLANARTLVFCVERENVESYKFTDSVIETDNEISVLDDNTISLGDLSIEAGNIIFEKDENGEFAIYKIEEVFEDNTASFSVPAIDEIYSELEIYGEYDWNIEDLVSNPEIEMEIIENVKKSSFFDELMIKAYAADSARDRKLDVKITPDYSDNSIEIEITITLEPGENGLFGIGELRNQEVSIKLSAKIGLTTKCNIQGIKNWDLSASITSGFSWTVNITLAKTDDTDRWNKSTDLMGLFSKTNSFANLIDYHKNAKKIVEKLNEISADATSGEIKLFDWNLPIPSVPGLYFSTEIKLFTKLEMAADIIIGQSNETVYTVGLCFINKKFEPYSNTYRSGKDVTLSLRGKAKAKAGIKLIIKATLINDKVANISLEPQVGLYTELYVTIPIAGVEEINDNNFLYSYFEPGVYFSCIIKAELNILVKKFEFSYELIEKKFPIDALTFGNKKIAMDVSVNANTVRAINNTVTVPDIMFEYYDVKSGTKGTEKLDLEKLKFVTNEGTSLSVDHGKLILPDAMSSGNCYVTATYLHSDGKTYSTIFRVLVSGSILEGKVSAYDSDLTAGELEGATVKLYSSSSSDTPISTVTTDENGRFSFNVSKGNYKLVISADGYHTLTSHQSVGEDEIKYTEHILLMDNSQSGNGSAGGTVSNALDGNGLGGVTLRLRTQWNNTTGAYYDCETTTSYSGEYLIQDIPVGYYTVEASLNGYVTGYSNIIVLSDNARYDFDFTITPIMNEDEVRIVLTWGATPYDLDSHLIGRTPSNDTFNVYYNSKVYRYDGVEMANLDVDDTTSYGPETVTILENIYGTYTYAVHDYSNRNSSSSNALSYSGAVVRVFMGSTQVAEYYVPTDQIGTYWTVFQIDSSGRIVPINTISNTKPEA